MLTYVAQHLGLPRSIGLLASVIGAGFQIVACPGFARLSDRFGRRPVTIFGAVGCMVWVFAFFPLMNTRSTTLIVIAVVTGLIFQAAMYGVQAAWICELFDTKHRYSGASIGYQLSGVVGGSLAPIIALSLLATFDSTVPVQLYIVLGCVIVMLTALATRETRGINIMPQAQHSPNNSVSPSV
jgi:MFS family permease